MEVSFLPVDPAVDSSVSKSLLLMLQIPLLFLGHSFLEVLAFIIIFLKPKISGFLMHMN